MAGNAYAVKELLENARKRNGQTQLNRQNMPDKTTSNVYKQPRQREKKYASEGKGIKLYGPVTEKTKKEPSTSSAMARREVMNDKASRSNTQASSNVYQQPRQREKKYVSEGKGIKLYGPVTKNVKQSNDSIYGNGGTNRTIDVAAQRRQAMQADRQNIQAQQQRAMETARENARRRKQG